MPAAMPWRYRRAVAFACGWPQGPGGAGLRRMRPTELPRRVPGLVFPCALACIGAAASGALHSCLSWPVIAADPLSMTK
eukprot:scaffold358438_cov44-Prasinocladus_malaysianus.AAC.2